MSRYVQPKHELWLMMNHFSWLAGLCVDLWTCINSIFYNMKLVGWSIDLCDPLTHTTHWFIHPTDLCDPCMNFLYHLIEYKFNCTDPRVGSISMTQTRIHFFIRVVKMTCVSKMLDLNTTYGRVTHEPCSKLTPM